MLKHKSYSVAALLVTTVIFRGGRSFGTKESLLDVEFAKRLELLRLVHSASTFPVLARYLVLLPQQSLFIARILHDQFPPCLNSLVSASLARFRSWS